MAVIERRIDQTPNRRAEATRGRYQQVRDLALAFQLQIKYINLGFVPNGIEVLAVVQPEDPTINIGIPHLWQITYRNKNGEVGTTSLKQYGGDGSSGGFVSFEMQDSKTKISWDMYGERTITES
ncbi:MAG: hypothetical protein WAT72_03340 [Microgenomates group bacterium]|jgi:hypothetical protein|nr:hypothetical protein [Candidatus Woesebacteria bacterium]MBP6883563.1 hypothetical protein [Candidatus Woesebacteria bacterium]MDQ5952983.1 hypothetical protein [Patescibacteria group bacterium]QQR63505.1 MAG: hypothetical protein IPH70_03270 [Candidatus Roizmanbacteria bacterium]